MNRPVSGTGSLLAHLAGDYLAQSSWMATEKVTRWWPALAHAASYAACFLPVTRNWRALLVIGGTHAVIDRYRLAKYLCWAKNQAAPSRYRYPWSAAGPTGFPAPAAEPAEGLDPVAHLRLLDRVQEGLAPQAIAGDVRTIRTLIRLVDVRSRILGLTPVTEHQPSSGTVPDWLATALLFIADNTIHLLINRWALRRWPA